MDINVLAENLTELLTNTVNMTDKFYDIFLNPTPMDVELQQYDGNNQLITVTIPNRAKDRRIALSGEGSPEGVVQAAMGTAYVDTDSEKVYFKVTDSGNTGWVWIVNSSNMSAAIQQALISGQYVTLPELVNYLTNNGYVKRVDLIPIEQDIALKANDSAVVHNTGNETVAGNKTFSGNTSIGSTLGVTGAATLSSTLGVTGATTLASTLKVTGNTTLTGTLGVTGATTLNGDLTAKKSTFTSGAYFQQGIQLSRGSGSTAYELGFMQSSPYNPLIKIDSASMTDLYIQKYGDNNYYKVINSNDIIGVPIPTMSNTLGDDEIWLEGAMVSKTTYAKLYAIYGDTYGTSTSTEFKLPDFRDRVMWGIGSGGTFGYIAAGLPNIKGKTTWFQSDYDYRDNNQGEGAFYTSEYRYGGTDDGDDRDNCARSVFDASYSNSIYSDSVTTVQPPAIKVRFKTKFK